MSTLTSIEETLTALDADIEASTLESAEDIETFRIQFLGKKQGRITGLMKRIPEVEPTERRAFGQRVNELKAKAQTRIDSALESRGPETASGSGIDYSLPGRKLPQGSLHPLTETYRLITRVFESYGFSVEMDIRFAKRSNQLRIRRTVNSSRCIDASDPKATELTFSLSSVTVCVLEGFVNGVLGNRINGSATTPVAFGFLKYATAAVPGRYSIFCAWHCLLILFQSC